MSILSASQVRGVEDPATVLLVPAMLPDDATWWSHEGMLLGGIKVNSITEVRGGGHKTPVRYLPTPVPRSWGELDFGVVVEYESEHAGADFRLRVYYGCGDPSELHLGQTEPITGRSDGKQRVRFRLRPEHLARNELFRCTVEVLRASPDPVLIYGAWLEVGV